MTTSKVPNSLIRSFGMERTITKEEALEICAQCDPHNKKTFKKDKCIRFDIESSKEPIEIPDCIQTNHSSDVNKKAYSQPITNELKYTEEKVDNIDNKRTKTNQSEPKSSPKSSSSLSIREAKPLKLTKTEREYIGLLSAGLTDTDNAGDNNFEQVHDSYRKFHTDSKDQYTGKIATLWRLSRRPHYYTMSELIKFMKWTPVLIDQFLQYPDETEENKYSAFGAPMQLYLAKRVWAMEQCPEYKEYQIQRKQVKAAIKNKRNEGSS